MGSNLQDRMYNGNLFHLNNCIPVLVCAQDEIFYTVDPSLSKVLLSTVLLAHSQPGSKNIKWKTLEINNS